MIYKNMRYACDFCTKRKRKCDKQLPCGLCESKRVKCTYSHQKDLELQLVNVEQRIRELQQNLLKPKNHIYKSRVMIQPQIKQVTLSKELEVELFERDHEHLLQLRFSKYPCIIYGVKESYYRESAKIFWPLRYALYASGALFVKDDQVPNGIADRLELVNLFLQKAQSFNFAENCTPLTVLTLETICNACYRIFN
ncbi:hypothetical protein HDV06_002068 [Boothiomyces sp. JEL0866]|nr:hypothetical protein HDV06_002068 [Boothiomyces sp. JEL0866]